MTGWRQAVFLRQRLDVLQRALSDVLDEETWSPATPRRLYVGGADASSRGWTMIVPELADFFLDPGGQAEPRLARLARALRCPGYEVDVRGPDELALHEVDARGRMRTSGSRRAPAPAPAGIDDPPASAVVSFGLVAMSDEIRGRVAALTGARASALALADYLGAIAGFPAWTHGAAAIAPAELVYEPPRIVATGRLATIPRAETRAASARTPLRVAPASFDRRGRRPRSVSRPRR
jgi:hypothetical protein